MLNFITEFFAYYWKLLRRVWWQASLVGILFTLPCDVLDLVITIYLEASGKEGLALLSTTVLYTVYTVVIGSLASAIVLNIVRAEPHVRLQLRDSQESGFATWAASAPGIFRNGVSAWVPMLLLLLLENLVYGFFALLCFLPFFYALVKLSTTAVLVIEEDASPTEALRNSWSQTEGHFWELLALWLLFAALILAVLSPFFGALFAVEYWSDQIVEPVYHLIGILLLIPTNVTLPYSLVFSFCIYKYLVRLESEPDRFWALESLRRELDPPQDDVEPTI